MDDIGLQKFCDCADGAGVNVHNVRTRLLTIRKTLTDMQELSNDQEVKNIRKYIVSAIADMSYGLEQFASRSINALCGASYVLGAVLPRVSSLGGIAHEVIGLASSIFGYFDPDDDNTLIEAITTCFESFFSAVNDEYVFKHMRGVRDILVQRKFFASAMDPLTTTDSEIGVLCQVIPSSEQMAIFRILEIRISDLLRKEPSTKEELSRVLTYIKIYCQLLSLRLVLACNTYDVIRHNPNFNNVAGGYLAAMFEYIRVAKTLLSPLQDSRQFMILSTVGPIQWPSVYSFLPVLGIKTNQSVDWQINDPNYPPGAVLAGRSTRGVESFIARIEKQSEIFIGQIKGRTCKWIGNVSEGVRVKSADKQKLKERTQNITVASSSRIPSRDEDNISKAATGSRQSGSQRLLNKTQGNPGQTIQSSRVGTRASNDKSSGEKIVVGNTKDKANDGNQTSRTALTENDEDDDSVEEDDDDDDDDDDDEEEDDDEDDDEDEDDDTANESDDSDQLVMDIPADVWSTDIPHEYQILCITDPKMKATWRPNVTGVPEGVGALKAGRDIHGEPYFIGRMFIDENPVIGMVTGTYFLFVTKDRLDYESDGMKYEVLCMESL